jgi:hypothetical protein
MVFDRGGAQNGAQWHGYRPGRDGTLGKCAEPHALLYALGRIALAAHFDTASRVLNQAALFPPLCYAVALCLWPALAGPVRKLDPTCNRTALRAGLGVECHYSTANKMEVSLKGLLIALLLLTTTSAFAQKKAGPMNIRVKIEASEWDKDLLMERLNNNGKGHKLAFESVEAGFDYRIVYRTGQGSKTSPSGMTGTEHWSYGEVTVYDNAGKELFSFDRGRRFTDKGATNAAAKEIIKRLRELRASKVK